MLHRNLLEWLSFLDGTSQRYVGPAAAPLKCYLVLSIMDFDQKLFSTLEDSHWHSEAQFLLLFLIGVARKYKAIQLCIYSKVGIFNTWLWLGGILSFNQSPLSNLRVASSQAQSWSTPSPHPCQSLVCTYFFCWQKFFLKPKWSIGSNMPVCVGRKRPKLDFSYLWVCKISTVTLCSEEQGD